MNRFSSKFDVAPSLENIPLRVHTNDKNDNHFETPSKKKRNKTRNTGSTTKPLNYIPLNSGEDRLDWEAPNQETESRKKDVNQKRLCANSDSENLLNVPLRVGLSHDNSLQSVPLPKNKKNKKKLSTKLNLDTLDVSLQSYEGDLESEMPPKKKKLKERLSKKLNSVSSEGCLQFETPPKKRKNKKRLSSPLNLNSDTGNTVDNSLRVESNEGNMRLIKKKKKGNNNPDCDPASDIPLRTIDEADLQETKKKNKKNKKKSNNPDLTLASDALLNTTDENGLQETKKKKKKRKNNNPDLDTTSDVPLHIVEQSSLQETTLEKKVKNKRLKMSDEPSLDLGSDVPLSENDVFQSESPFKSNNKFDQHSASTEGLGKSKNHKNFIIQKLTTERVKKGLVMLPQKTETKIYKLKKALHKKGVPEEEIKRAVNYKRRREELDMRKDHPENVCFRCREWGHFFADCPLVVKDTDQGVGVCFRCGSTEHILRDCSLRMKKGGILPFAKCFVCGKVGHISRECPENPRGAYPKGGKCNVCGSINHLRRDCPQMNELENEQPTARVMIAGMSADALDD